MQKDRELLILSFDVTEWPEDMIRDFSRVSVSMLGEVHKVRRAAEAPATPLDIRNVLLDTIRTQMRTAGKEVINLAGLGAVSATGLSREDVDAKVDQLAINIAGNLAQFVADWVGQEA
jgi:hypothetical protein